MQTLRQFQASHRRFVSWIDLSVMHEVDNFLDIERIALGFFLDPFGQSGRNLALCGEALRQQARSGSLPRHSVEIVQMKLSEVW